MGRAGRSNRGRKLRREKRKLFEKFESEREHKVALRRSRLEGRPAPAVPEQLQNEKFTESVMHFRRGQQWRKLGVTPKPKSTHSWKDFMVKLEGTNRVPTKRSDGQEMTEEDMKKFQQQQAVADRESRAAISCVEKTE
ncbi:MAG: hypothetical protein MHM6MM_003770 [Cercozoa sp. M6MM]